MNETIMYRLKDVSKTYLAGKQNVHAIRNLNCEIFKEDFTVIMGSSGSGKSTLLYLLSGMDSVTSGEVYFGNQAIHDMKEKQLLNMRQQQIGMIYQGIHLIPYLTLLENVVVTAKLTRKNHAKAVAISRELLDRLQLSAEMDRLPAQVSGGQQQRGAVARALANECNVLFADEPTGALNTSQGENMLDILSEINQAGKTIVMVTHDLKAACRGNRILFIKDGKIEGDLRLPFFNKNEPIDEREQKVYQFLRQRGW
jgi:putative ABC transport system ATP-binding protein